MRQRTPAVEDAGHGTHTRQAHQPRPWWEGAAFLLAVLALMLAATSVRNGSREPLSTLLLVLTLASWLPLTVRNRWPLGALVAALAVESLHLALMPVIDPGQVADPTWGAFQPVPLATTVAAYTYASRSSRVKGWVAGVGAAAWLIALSHVAEPSTGLAPSLLMFDVVIIATALGALLAGRRERLRRLAIERRDETQRQIVAERVRIARELHDVLAHSITLVNAQAGVAAYLVRNDPRAAEEALEGITEHTRRALDELRATVGLLRQDGDPPESGTQEDLRGPLPGLADLDQLLAGFRSAGASVTGAVTGTPSPLSAQADLAVYRIVQEALTNATKHAPGAPVHVQQTWARSHLEVQITNDAPAAGTPRGAGTGHGLIGMNERAVAAGGRLQAGRTASWGYEVRASIPTLTTEPVAPAPPADDDHHLSANRGVA